MAALATPPVFEKGDVVITQYIDFVWTLPVARPAMHLTRDAQPKAALDRVVDVAFMSDRVYVLRESSLDVFDRSMHLIASREMYWKFDIEAGSNGRLYLAGLPYQGIRDITVLDRDGQEAETLQLPFVYGPIDVAGCILFSDDWQQVNRYDVCQHKALSSIAAPGLLSSAGLPDGGVVVGGRGFLDVYDASGTHLRRRTIGDGHSGIGPIAFADDGRSIWLWQGGDVAKVSLRGGGEFARVDAPEAYLLAVADEQRPGSAAALASLEAVPTLSIPSLAALAFLLVTFAVLALRAR
ncbi:MAG TPA: hypothetical protein VFN10_02620 [Thermoanaerobaculia bacterium]|nr:hypothetical protein [Thermoanaerobaculia bacterium]